MKARDYCGWLPLHEASNHGFYGESISEISTFAESSTSIFFGFLPKIISPNIMCFMKINGGFLDLSKSPLTDF